MSRSRCSLRPTSRVTLWGCLLLGFFVLAVQADEPAAKTQAPSQEQLIKQLAVKLTGCKMTGRFTIVGQEDGKTVPEEYTITSAIKLPEGDTWLLKTRIKYGGTDVTIPVPLEIKWAGQTPVITLDNIALPGLGTFSSRVVLDGDKYAGTWSHDKVGGHLFGTLEKAPAEEKKP